MSQRPVLVSESRLQGRMSSRPAAICVSGQPVSITTRYRGAASVASGAVTSSLHQPRVSASP